MYSLQGFPDKGSNAGVSHESLAGSLLPSSKPPSPLVFLLISTHFTATLGIPLTSPALKTGSFQCSPGVEPPPFTSDLPVRLRSLYTQ